MKERISRLYPRIVVCLLAFWLIWFLIPLPHSLDPHGGIKLVGFIPIEVLLLVFGIVGFVLAHEGFVNFEFALSIFTAPILHFFALGTESPFHYMVYALPFVLSAAFFPYRKGL